MTDGSGEEDQPGDTEHEAVPLAGAAAYSPPTDVETEGRFRRRSRARRSWRHIAVEWLIVAAAAVLLALGIRAVAFQAFFIPSGSMIPTLGIGDRILVEKLFFSPSDLKTGDIIVFKRPPADVVCGLDEADFVKRVIGLPGETISSQGNAVLINGKPLSEPYLPKGQPLDQPIKTQVVPAHEYFVMGDNRPDSCDSRYWGDVSANEVIGKVVLTWWHNGRPELHFF